MASTAEAIEERCAALTLEEEEEIGGLVVGAEDVCEEVQSFKFAAVGRLLTDRPIKFPIVRDTMAGVWRLGKGVTIKELQHNLFLFQFYHEFDLTRILEDDPWSFEQNLLVVQRLAENQSPLSVALTAAEFWVQVHNLPMGFMSVPVAEAIGGFVGRYIKADQSNFDGTWKTFMRIRVEIDVAKPLKRKMKLKKNGGEWVWVEFRYERLPTFYFLCGLLGHSDRYCEKNFEDERMEGEKPYGVWLRAAGRRQSLTVGQRCLVDGAGTRGSGVAGDSGSSVAVGNVGMGHGVAVTLTCTPMGDVCMSHVNESHVHGVGALSRANVGTEEGVVIVDQKRRRVEENVGGEVGQLSSMAVVQGGFKFENVWVRDAECREVVGRSWDSGVGIGILQKVEKCGQELQVWGRSRVRDFAGRLERCRRRRNSITRLRDDVGNWISGSPDLGSHMVGYFEDLFTSSRGDISPILECVTGHVSDDHNAMLLRSISAEEVWVACEVTKCCWQKVGVAMNVGRVFVAERVITHAQNIWHGWRQANGIREVMERHGPTPPQQWCKPEHGRWKLNVDAAFEESSGTTSIGMVIRDEGVILSLPKPFQDCTQFRLGRRKRWGFGKH
nr:uncharacterized protein LOC109179748 [Ipomoea batatas]